LTLSTGTGGEPDAQGEDVAVLRITLSLLVLLCLAAPAVAQPAPCPSTPFAPCHLEGAWTIAGVETSTRADSPGGWLSGSIGFDRDGRVLSGLVINDRDDQTTLDTGALTVSSNGSVSGTVGNDESTTIVRGRLLPDKQVIVAVTTTDPDSANPTYALVVLVKVGTPRPDQPLFSQADVTGTWRVASLLIPELPAPLPETLAGVITFSNEGEVTSGSLFSSRTSNDATVNGNLFLGAGGVFSGTFALNRATDNDISGFAGFMSPDKSLLVGIVSRAGSGSDLLQNGFLVLQRQVAPASPFTLADLAGRWDLFSLQAHLGQGNTGEWHAGNVTINSTGLITGGTLTGPGDEQDEVANINDGESNRVTIDANGTVRGNIVTELRVLEFTGAMNAAKDRIGGADFFRAIEGSNVDHVGAFALLKVDATPAATVQFQQGAYTVKENVASLIVTVERTGSLTTPSTVTYTAVPINAVRDKDFALTPPTTLSFAAGVKTRTFTVKILNNTLLDGNRSFTLVLGTPTNGVQLGSPSSTTVTITDDDQPGTIQLDKTAYTVPESAGTLAIIVRRTGTNLAGDVTVDFLCDALSATDEGDPLDYACPLIGTPPNQSRTLTFKAGEPMKTVSIPIFRDNVVDGPKTLRFRLLNPSPGVVLPVDTATALITITDVDLPGVIKFTPDKYSVSEGAGQVTLTVKRTGGTGGGVLVDYITKDGTAVGGDGGDGTDFVHRSGTLTFLFGNTSATITIPIRQDTLAEGNETFTVELLRARTANGDLPAAVLPTPGRIATVTIVDDESAFQFSAATYSGKEGTPNAVITVLRTGTLTSPATVTYTASPGTAQPGQDFTPVAGLLSFPANTPSKTFNVPIINNTRLDLGPRTVQLALGNPTGGALLGTQRTAVLTIEDNEQAGTFKLDKGTYTVLESAGFVSVTVTRTGLNLTGNVSVTLVATDDSARNGTNYSFEPTTLTFGAGETSKVVKVNILRDQVVTGPRKFTLALTQPSSGATVGTPGTATVNITDADVAGSVKFSAATYVVNESGGQAVVTLVRTGGAAGGVVVRVFTQDGTAVSTEGGDYRGIDQLVTFAAGNNSATVSIPITPDSVAEDDKSFQVKLSLPNPNPNPSGVIIAAPSTATVTIMDDDASMVQFNGEFIGNFPVIQRDGNLKRVVVVDFETADDGTAIPGVDFTPVRGSITFAANTSKATIPLVIANDTIAEGFETFTYRLVNPRGARLGAEAQRTFTITDNDFGGSNIQFTAPTFSGTEGQTVTLNVVRTGGLGSSLVVQWTSGNGSATAGTDFTPASGSFTFAANSLTASFTITLLNDNLLEGTETVPIILSMPEAAATLGPQFTTTLQILDKAPPASVVQFTSPTFSAVNDQNKEITLVRSGALGSPIVINWTATGGTAVPGEDFSPTSGTVTFGPNDTTASFFISTREGGGGGDPDVTVVLGLSVESGAATIGAVNTATLTILGSASELNLDFSVYSVTEGGGPAIVTVTRRGNVNREVSVDFATSNGTGVAGTHYTARTGRLTVPAGASTATFTIPILSNGPGDGVRTVNLALTNPSPNTTLGEGDTARLEIRESPPYAFTLIAATDGENLVGIEGTPGINDAGTVAFKGRIDDSVRVLRGKGGELTTIAAVGSDGIADIGNRFPIDNDGNVAFVATLDSEERAIFRGDDESLTPIATTGGRIVDLFDPAMSGNGNVAFAGLFSDVTDGTSIRLFTRSGSTSVPVPGTDSPNGFTNIGIHPSVNDGGVVAFVGTVRAVIDDQVTFVRGIHSVDASGERFIDASDVDVATFTNVSLNGSRQVAFIPGSGNLRTSVLRTDGDGSALPVATAADGFQDFGEVSTDDNSPVINDRGDVAFLALTQAGNIGILTGRNPVANTPIQVGDPLFGSNVAFLTFGGINATGRIVFRATLLDGREVVAVAAPPATISDLAVSTTVSNATPLVGDRVTFTVTARNNGPAAATNVVVTDQLPSGLTFVAAAVPLSTVYVPATGVWTVGTLAANATATLLITATVQASSPATNTASISAVGVSDPTPANNTASVTVTPTQQADIAVEKTASTPTPVIGSNVIFTLKATNNGPAAATNVQVTDLLPTGFAFVSAVPGQGTYTSGTGIWALGNLAANASAQLQITARVLTTGNYTNTATRTASTPVDANAANDTATATVTPISGIALTTEAPLIGVNRTINGTASIPITAPSGGVTITLNTNPTGIVNLSATSLTIPAGGTSVPFTITGAAVGTTTISATATGFGPGSVDVTVTSSSISLGSLPALGPGQTTSLPISLSTAAPASGLTVSFTSTNTDVATVTSSVFIPGGSQVPAANPQVTALAVGSTQINAVAIGFAPDSRGASVSVNVTFTPSSLSVVVGTSNNITVNIAAPAPSNGLTLALVTGNTNVATVASPVTIPAGQLSVQTAVTGVTAGQSTTLQATGTGVTSATANITVTTPPVINLSPLAPTIGRNLQVQVSPSLAAAAPAGGVSLTVTSAEPARLLVSTSNTAQGSGQVVLPINAGSGSSVTPLFLQALDGTGTVQLTLAAPGFTTRTTTITLGPSAIVFNPFFIGNFGTTTFSANQTIQLVPALLNASNQFVTSQILRGGLGPINVAVTATDQPTGGSSVGTIVNSPAVFNGGDSFKNLAFDPAAAGTSLLEVVQPTGLNFSTTAVARQITATVTAPGISINNQTIGRDLQVQGSVFLNTAAPTGGIVLTLTSADANRVVLSTSAAAQGTGQITLNYNAGSSSPTSSFFIQALDSTGTVQLTATAPGYANQVGTVTLAPSGFVINPFQISNFTTSTRGGNQPIQIVPALLTNPGLAFQTNQALRGGRAPVTVNVTATDQPNGGSSVGTILDSPVTFNPGDTAKNVQFDPVAAGASLIQVDTPAGFSTPNNARAITATVNTPGINNQNLTIGQNLQVQQSVSLLASAPTALSITVTSADPNRVVLSTSATTQGTGQVSIPINAGQFSSTTPLFIQALSDTGTVQVTASAPGFTSQIATITLGASGFVINPFQIGNFATTTFSGPTVIQITPALLSGGNFSQIQPIRGGLTGISVPLTATDEPGGGSTVGSIIGSPAVFNANDSSKSLQFDPSAVGVSLIQVGTPTGFSTPNNARQIRATVTAPTITFSSFTLGVGKDLQQAISIFLGAAPPSPVTLTVTVASTAVATVVTNANATQAGTNTVTFTNVTSTNAGTIFVQGRAASGTTSITAQAPGFSDGVMTVTAQPSGFVTLNGNFTTTANATSPAQLSLAAARLNATTLNFETSQGVRGGLTVDVPVTAADQTGTNVGTITTSPVRFNSNVISATTGFDPNAAGTSVVTVGVPTGFSTPSNQRQITVTVNP
jgi:uncharacterized repeat protein (TIGR01451 family)